MLELLNTLADVTCKLGAGNSITIDTKIPNIVATIISVIQFAVPVLLIIWGMLDLGKAVVASKEDEIKNAQKMLIKRAIYAVAIFFVVLIAQLVFGLLNGSQEEGTQNPTECIDCFINGNCEEA